MGCGAGKEKVDAHKVAMQGRDFSGFSGMGWSGLAASFPNGGIVDVVKSGGVSEVQANGSKVMTIQEQGGGEKGMLIFTDFSGASVGLVHMHKMGTFGSPSLWHVWSATPSSAGQQAELAPNGSQMYRCGQFTTPKQGQIQYTDQSDAPVMMAKSAGYTNGIVFGPDSASQAATVEGMKEGAYRVVGKVTFPKGVDPMLAFVMIHSVFQVISGA